MYFITRKNLMNLSVVAALSGFALTNPTAVWAQQKAKDKKHQLVGNWAVVSVDTTGLDGKTVQGFGPNPQGLLTFDANGRYALQICSSDRPKFASNSRANGTPEENQAAVRGCNPHWGRYSVSDGAINFKIEHAMFPNWEGTEQKRPFTIKRDELTYSVPAASTGGTAKLVWKRVN